MICSSIPEPHLLLSWKNRAQTLLLKSAAGLQNDSSNRSSLPHHEQSHLISGHRLQIRNRERLREGGATSQGLCCLHCRGEAVQPGPLAGAPDSGAGLWRAVTEGRWHRGPTQELVQVETHGQGGEALHVGAVDELLATNDVGLEEEETSAPTGNDERPAVITSFR